MDKVRRERDEGYQYAQDSPLHERRRARIGASFSVRSPVATFGQKVGRSVLVVVAKLGTKQDSGRSGRIPVVSQRIDGRCDPGEKSHLDQLI